MAKGLILGMGNPIASDDAIGIVIAEKLKKIINDPKIEIKTTECGGLNILDLICGYDFLIVIDAIKTGKHKPGEIVHFKAEEYDFTHRSAAVHDVSFFQAIELGRRMGMKIPDRIEIISIEIVENRIISEKLSPKVEAAIEPVIEKIKGLIS